MFTPMTETDIRRHQENKQSVPRRCQRCKCDRLALRRVENQSYAELSCSECGHRLCSVGRAIAIDEAQAHRIRSGKYNGKVMGDLPPECPEWLKRSETIPQQVRARAELVLLANWLSGKLHVSRLASIDLSERRQDNPDGANAASHESPSIPSKASVEAKPCSGQDQAANAQERLTGVTDCPNADAGNGGEA